MPIFVQHNNPVAPATGASADDLANAYQVHAAAIRGETQQAATEQQSNFNPYKPQVDTQQDAQQSHLADMQQFLAPIPMNQYDIDTEHTDEHGEVFHDNLIHDPWFKNHGEDFQNKLETIQSGIEQGLIDKESGVSMAKSYFNDVVKPDIHKYHGPHSDTHKKSMHDKEHAAFLKKQSGAE